MKCKHFKDITPEVVEDDGGHICNTACDLGIELKATYCDGNINKCECLEELNESR